MKKVFILTILVCLVFLVGCQQKPIVYEPADDINGHYLGPTGFDQIFVDVEKLSDSKVKFQIMLEAVRKNKSGRDVFYSGEHGDDLDLVDDKAVYTVSDCVINLEFVKDNILVTDNNLCAPEDSELSFTGVYKKDLNSETEIDWVIYDNLMSWKK